MLVFVDLLEFEVVVAPELGVASSHGVGGFQQIVANETVAVFDEPSVLGLKVTGLVLVPDKASELGDRGLGLEAVDIADLGDDTGGVNLADTRDRYKGVVNNFKLLRNGLVQYFDLLFQSAHGGNRDSHCLIHRVVHCNRQVIGVSGGGLNSLGFGLRVSKITV